MMTKMIGSLTTAVAFLIIGMLMTTTGTAPVFMYFVVFGVALGAGALGIAMALAYNTPEWQD